MLRSIAQINPANLLNIRLYQIPTRARLNFSAASNATIGTKPYKLYLLDESPKSEVQLTRDDAIDCYTKMQTIRRLEAANQRLYIERQIRGYCHLYTGQEACAVGIVASLNSDDAVITSFRCHGWAHLMGASVDEVFEELTGRTHGDSHGKGGSMHMYTKRFYGGNGIVGAQIPLGAGIAFAMKYRHENSISLALYGDGAANQGQFFETVNMAELWKLPVLFICENNGYAMGTSVKRGSSVPEFYKRGGFVPGIWVDGMDVLSVREAIRFSREWVLKGNGPLVLEMSVYRYVPHSMTDPDATYRAHEEIEKVRKTRDSLAHFRDQCEAAGLIEPGEFKAIDSDVHNRVDSAVKKALSDPVPPPEELYTDIYANCSPIKIRGTTPEHIVRQQFTTTEQMLRRKERRS